MTVTKDLLNKLHTRHTTLFDRRAAEYHDLRNRKLENNDEPSVLSTIEARMPILSKVSIDLDTAADQWSAARDSFYASGSADIGPIVRLLDSVEATLNAGNKPATAPKPPVLEGSSAAAFDTDVAELLKELKRIRATVSRLEKGVVPAKYAEVIKAFRVEDLHAAFDGTGIMTPKDRELLDQLHDQHRRSSITSPLDGLFEEAPTEVLKPVPGRFRDRLTARLESMRTHKKSGPR